jgi:hypothetical protein
MSIRNYLNHKQMQNDYQEWGVNRFPMFQNQVWCFAYCTEDGAEWWTVITSSSNETYDWFDEHALLVGLGPPSP